MSWLKEKIRSWLTDTNESKFGGAMLGKSANSIASCDNSFNSNANLNFTVYNAIGGKVIEFRRYNRTTDRTESSMYVITNEDNFGERIAKIATLEVMK